MSYDFNMKILIINNVSIVDNLILNDFLSTYTCHR